MDRRQSILYQLIATSMLCAGTANAGIDTESSLHAFPSSIPGMSELPSESERVVGATLSLGVPQVAEIGVNYWKSAQWNFFAQGGYVPLPITANGSLSVLNIEAGSQYHFLQNAFFIGLSAGFQRISYATTVDFSSFSSDLGPQPSHLGMQSFYLAPSFGFLWRKKSGFLIGFDIGLGIPIFASGRLDVNGDNPLSNSVGSASENAMGYFGSLGMPRIHLIRVGWLF